MKKLILIDGMSLVFRAYHAMAKTNLQSPSGEPTYAVYGFVNFIESLLKKESPDLIAVAFDLAAPTFRHELYENYKANRDEFPEPLVPQLARIKSYLDLRGIPRIEIPGFEADDIIGALAKSRKDDNVFCVTSDKDYYQLVDEHIKLLKPSKTQGKDFDLVDEAEVYNKFGVRPDQVIDVLALIGDTADNIPGVKGIGDKTAIPLIQEYGSIDNLYQNIDKIEKAAVQKKLTEGKDSAYLALKLVTIATDMELPTINLELAECDESKLFDFYSELNLNQFKKRIKTNSETFDTPFIKENQNINEAADTESNIEKFDESKVDYKLISDRNSLAELCDILKKQTSISVDIETSSLDRNSCSLAGISISFAANQAYYIAVRDAKSSAKSDVQVDLFSQPATESSSDEKIDIARVAELLNPIFQNESIAKFGQNIKFDAYILRRLGMPLVNIDFDTMIAGNIIDTDSPANMDALSKKWLNYEPIPIEEIIGKKKSEQKSMTDLEPNKIKNYACEDADVTYKLREKLAEKLDEEKLTDLAYRIEMPIIEVLCDMEYTGIKIDIPSLAEISTQIASSLEGITKNIFEEAGETFNIDSPKQLGFILFERMMLPPTKKTKTGYSTDVETLNSLKYDYPIADLLLQYRQLTKLKSTYIDALPKLINPNTGRLHTTFNQYGANTGRLSSTDPNLQNIPVRSDLGKEIRKAFIPGHKGWKLISADYSQIELRIMAYFSQDKNLIGAFQNDADIHAATAAILNDISIDEVNADQRRVAKTVNFGIMYGLGSFGLSQRLGISRKESQEIIKNYFEKYPGIKEYMDTTIANAESKGYAETLCGRRRYFPEINSSNKNIKAAAQRAAINMPIQGSASDMIKIAMLKTYNAIKQNKLQAKMLLQVHDELVFEAPEEEIEILTNLARREMESSLPLGETPVKVEIGVGSNWLEAH
jgi:DNA polymerase-1